MACVDADVRDAVELHTADIVGELNVKRVDVLADDSSLVTLRAKANFKRLGRRLGKRMKTVATLIEGLEASQVEAILAGQPLVLDGDTIDAEDILVQRDPLAGRVVSSEGGITVVLDTTMDRDLIHEGLMRELINRVQSLRKTAQLDVSDRIELHVGAQGKLSDALQDSALEAMLRTETLTTVLHTTELPHPATRWCALRQHSQPTPADSGLSPASQQCVFQVV